MIAFHGKQETKEFYIARVKKHREMDNLIQGEGWNGERGCAVGCTLENYDHAQYEKELGVPEWLARLEDTIFEGLPKEKAMFWPERFLSAINPGADLEKVKTPFLIFILEQNLIYLDGVKFDAEKFPDVLRAVEGSRAAVKEVIRCHKAGDDLSAARSAARSAWAAAGSAESASASESAASAARSAAGSAAGSAAWSAARSAARSAAWSAARSAESASESAASAASAESAAAYEKYADKLIELIEGCE